ncbi:MAG: hypothetical protein EXR51_10425 [Dehalococcoidia bacterium]|nr:hypothetical protein [Dehalococcoidia bacterium]
MMGLIGGLYLVFATQYVAATPRWQAPDEPAHFNYARHIADGSGLPVLGPGDYDQQHLQRLVSEGFPPGEPVNGLKYESHQPPLYYVAAASLLTLVESRDVGQQVLALRLLSLSVGLGVVLLGYAAASEVFRDCRSWTAAAAAIVALLPQHVAMLSAVNNDGIAELGLGAVLVLSLHLLRAGFSGLAPGWGFWVGLGLALGWVLLAKTTVYVAVLLPGAAAILGWSPRSGPRRSIGIGLLAAYGLAGVLSGPWFWRNQVEYGGLDILGLGRHAAVVYGQPRVEAWDWWRMQEAAGVVFQSFCVQLGWMGVPASPEVYRLLAVLSGLAAAGVVVWLAGGARGVGPVEGRFLCLLGGLLVLVVFQLAAYNLQFLQAQGRYLFPALVPIACLTCVGLRELLTPRSGGLVAAATIGGLAALNVYALQRLIPHLTNG